MKKKLIICCSSCILILCVCLLIFVNKKKTDNYMGETASASVNSTAETETEIIETKITEVCTAVGSEDDEDDTVYVFYLEDEAVRNNSIFDAFVNKEITAYDDVKDENRYILNTLRAIRWCLAFIIWQKI